MSEVNEKVALVLDESCIWRGKEKCCKNCNFLSYHSDDFSFSCRVLDSVNIEGFSDWKIPSDKIDSIEVHCPFKSVPKLKDIESMRFPQSDDIHPAYKEGWNDAINILIGGDISHITAEYCESHFIQIGKVVLYYEKNDVRVKHLCGSCNCEHFLKYVSSEGTVYYVCECCKAVYKEKKSLEGI